MATFAFYPDAAKSWATKVIGYLNGESDSVKYCSKKFEEQLKQLVQPDVWTGTAAAQNYQNFLTAHEILVKFINGFGEQFQKTMSNAASATNALEMNNYGSSMVSQKFGNLDYAKLTDLSKSTIDKDYVTYNYEVISSIGKSLSEIRSIIDTVNTNLQKEINVLGDGNVWNGSSAERAKTDLLGELNNGNYGIKKINEALDICIKNINDAAEAARLADTK